VRSGRSSRIGQGQTPPREVAQAGWVPEDFNGAFPDLDDDESAFGRRDNTSLGVVARYGQRHLIHHPSLTEVGQNAGILICREPHFGRSGRCAAPASCVRRDAVGSLGDGCA
jgi:hypothetical protein